MDKNNEISAETLASAFQGDSKKAPSPEKKTQKPKGKKNTKKIVSIIVLILGIITLIAGLVVLIIKITKGATISDAEYLVSAKEWRLETDDNCGDDSDAENCESGVIWKFTEIGKGTLTTNNHTNDYDFIWALDGDTLKINTDWLYTINDEYTYKLDKGAGKLTVETEDEKATFVRIQDEE